MRNDRKIRWGILGTARIARKVAAAIHSSANAQLIAIASRSVERGKLWASEHGCPQVFGSYAELLQQPEIDAIYIPLPPHLHCEWTLRAAAAGKHILVEKPLAMSVSEALQMQSACQEAGVQCWDGVMWYHHPRAAAIKQSLKEGRIGLLRRMTCAFSHAWSSSLPAAQEYRYKREMGGGSLMDLGWYCLSAAIWAFEKTPIEVWGRGQYENEVDSAFSGTLYFSEGAEASFDCSFDLPARRWLELAGSAGTIVCDDFTRPWKEDKTRYWLHNSQGEAEVVSFPALNQETCMIEQFSRPLLLGKIENDWLQRSIATQYTLEALVRSAQENRPVMVQASE